MILCVDIGGTSTKAALLSPDGEVTHLHSIPSKPPAQHFMSLLLQTIVQIRKASPSPVSQLGVAVAGFLDDARTRLVYNSNLPWLENYPIRSKLHESFPDLSIELEVDSNAAALAEYRFGGASHCKRFLCLTSGTGLGVGMIINGSPLRFAYGCVGDAGHVIVRPDGLPCPCGGVGCAEVMVSSVTIAAQYQALLNSKKSFSLRDVIDAAQEGDHVAVYLLKQAGECLGIAAASLASVFFPEQIAIAGGLSAAGPFVIDPAAQMFRKSASQIIRKNVKFGAAALSANATLIGAACPFIESEVHLIGKSVS